MSKRVLGNDPFQRGAAVRGPEPVTAPEEPAPKPPRAKASGAPNPRGKTAAKPGAKGARRTPATKPGASPSREPRGDGVSSSPAVVKSALPNARSKGVKPNSPVVVEPVKTKSTPRGANSERVRSSAAALVEPAQTERAHGISPEEANPDRVSSSSVVEPAESMLRSPSEAAESVRTRSSSAAFVEQVPTESASSVSLSREVKSDGVSSSSAALVEPARTEKSGIVRSSAAAVVEQVPSESTPSDSPSRLSESVGVRESTQSVSPSHRGSFASPALVEPASTASLPRVPGLPAGEREFAPVDHAPAEPLLRSAAFSARGLARAVRTALGLGFGTELDPFGRDSELVRAVDPLLDFLCHRYWRVSLEGAHQVPTGRAIVVANHGGALPLDGPVLQHMLARARPDLREPRWLVEDQVFHAPMLGTLLNRLGAVRACPENAVALLEEERPILVFPEGSLGLGKTYFERYRLKRFGRGGFVKLALRLGAPIVPVAILGAEDATPLLAKLPGRLLGLAHLPVAPLGLLPLPVRWLIRFGTPIDTADAPAEAWNDLAYVQSLTERTRMAIEGMLEALQRERPFPL